MRSTKRFAFFYLSSASFLLALFGQTACSSNDQDLEVVDEQSAQSEVSPFEGLRELANPINDSVSDLGFADTFSTIVVSSQRTEDSVFYSDQKLRTQFQLDDYIPATEDFSGEPIRVELWRRGDGVWRRYARVGRRSFGQQFEDDSISNNASFQFFDGDRSLGTVLSACQAFRVDYSSHLKLICQGAGNLQLESGTYRLVFRANRRFVSPNELSPPSEEFDFGSPWNFRLRSFQRSPANESTDIQPGLFGHG